MANQNVFVVGSHLNNGPTRQIFVQAGQGGTFDEAVQAAIAHWSMNFGKGATPAYRVYRSDDGKSGVVEILDQAVMTCFGLYKIQEMFFAGVPAATPPQP